METWWGFIVELSSPQGLKPPASSTDELLRTRISRVLNARHWCRERCWCITWLVTLQTHLLAAFLTCQSMLGFRFKLNCRAARMGNGTSHKACGAHGHFEPCSLLCSADVAWVLFSIRKHFFSESSGHGGLNSAVLTGKTPNRHRSYFFLDSGLQDCALSTNMLYVGGLIPRSGEQTHSMLPAKGVERTRRLEI